MKPFSSHSNRCVCGRGVGGEGCRWRVWVVRGVGGEGCRWMVWVVRGVGGEGYGCSVM